MPELRKDPVTGRWVVIATDRQKRPIDFQFGRTPSIGREHCPFCPGHESLTPPEILVYRQNGGGPNTAGWDLRVVPNKFPALQVEGALDREGDGLFDRMNGIGAHEVIIETPDHDRHLALMSEAEIERVLSAYRERMNDLKRDVRLRYILIFKNHGGPAGATLEHPHSQLLAMPLVPDFVRDEIDGARRHFAAKERCIFCDIIRQETKDGRRLVFENADIVAFAPYASRFAFEVRLLPRRHGARFEDAPGHEYEGLAKGLKAVLQRMDRALESPAYNLIVRTLPVGPVGPGVAGADDEQSLHWYVTVAPRVALPLGIEWSTGLFINPVAPEEAARVLRDATV